MVAQSSRRIEHSFLSFFYLLQQSTIAANANGTIVAPPAPGQENSATFREVAPDLWREIGGTRELALQTVDGVKTVVDSEDPTSVLQAVPAQKSATLNVAVLLGSVAILFWTLVLWGLSPLLRRGDRAQTGISPEIRRLRLIARLAAAFDAIYLVGWAMLMRPLLTNDLQVFSSKSRSDRAHDAGRGVVRGRRRDRGYLGRMAHVRDGLDLAVAHLEYGRGGVAGRHRLDRIHGKPAELQPQLLRRFGIGFACPPSGSRVTEGVDAKSNQS